MSFDFTKNPGRVKTNNFIYDHDEYRFTSIFNGNRQLSFSSGKSFVPRISRVSISGYSIRNSCFRSAVDFSFFLFAGSTTDALQRRNKYNEVSQ